MDTCEFASLLSTLVPLQSTCIVSRFCLTLVRPCVTYAFGGAGHLPRRHGLEHRHNRNTERAAGSDVHHLDLDRIWHRGGGPVTAPPNVACQPVSCVSFSLPLSLSLLLSVSPSPRLPVFLSMFLSLYVLYMYLPDQVSSVRRPGG